MAFKKTGISFGKVSITKLDNPENNENLEVGQEKDGQIWTGEKWVSKDEWEKLNNG